MGPGFSDHTGRTFSEGFPGWEVEHASLVETSLVMHFRPDLGHAELIPAQKGEKHKPRPLIFPEPANLVPESGILYTAMGAGPDKGAAIAGGNSGKTAGNRSR